VDLRGFLSAVEDLRDGCIDGINVTMPHKAAAAAAADLADEIVRATGAANTLRRGGSPDRPVVEATNTDVGGIAAAADAAGIPPDAPVLVLGAGGGAAAAVVAFRDRLAGVSTRRAGNVGALAERTGVPVRPCPWGEAVDGVVVVNATPLGMRGEMLPGGILDAAVGLIDLPYGEVPTPAMQRAHLLGIRAVDGLRVLVAQAAISFTWWTDVPAPLDVMHPAAQTA